MKYKAFISYSHADSSIAARLHSRLESYVPPKLVRKKLENEGSKPWRLRPIFIDKEELGAARELSGEIQDALAASEALIVVCSPSAVQSNWVNREIEYFRKLSPQRPIFAFVAAGDPALDPSVHPAHAAFPLSLLEGGSKTQEKRTIEPLAADARKEAGGFSTAFLKLAAGLLGVKFDQLRQRDLRRQQKRLVAFSVLASALAIAFAVIALRAIQSEKAANIARKQAEVQLVTEQQTRAFLLSVFKLAEPSEARGNQVTVREVLDRAVQRIGEAEFSSELINAELLSTMAQAYANLGLNAQSLDLFAQSSSLISPQQEQEQFDLGLSNKVGAANVHFVMGEYESADKMLAEADILMDSEFDAPALQTIKLLNIRGDLASYQEQGEVAKRAYRAAIVALDKSDLAVNDDVSERSRSLGGLALLAHFQGNGNMAEDLYSESAALLLRHFGENHPDTLWANTSLASAAYLNGNTSKANSVWRRALEVAIKVLGERHPEIATIRNSLGLLELERGDFSDAEANLKLSVEIDRETRTEQFDDLVYPLTNLALVYLYKGETSNAQRWLDEASGIIGDSNHRWRGPVANHNADLFCLTGDIQDGKTSATAAVEQTLAEFGEGDWRHHQAIVTQQYCLALSGEKAQFELVQRGLSVISDRWSDVNCYAQRAIQQAIEIARRSNINDGIEFERRSLGWLSPPLDNL